MREIKYRALYKPYNVMIPWAQIEAMIDGKQIIVQKKELWAGKPNEQVEYESLRGNPFHHIDLIMLEYTGLKNKNGKEIYDGDICKFVKGGAIFKCIFNLGRFYLSDGLCGFYMKEDWNEEVEVIGNIYENPELLKEKS